MARNPFIYGRELGRGELVDRQEELRQIDTVVDDRARLFVIGPRRYGKTSLLRVAGERAAARGVLVLRFDAERYEGLDMLAGAILTAAARGLQDPIERVAAWIAAVAARLRPEVTIDPEAGQLTVGLSVDPATHGEVALLADALDAVNDLAAKAGRDVVVILDEVQQVVVEHGLAAEKQLRAAVQRHENVGYVLAGSDTRLLTEMTEDGNRPFYRLGARLFLGPVPEAEFEAFLDGAFARTGFRVHEGACRYLLEVAEQVPYNVQRLAAEAWDMLRGGERRVLSVDAVEAALARIVRKEDPAYTQVWIGLTRNQRKALRLVAESDGTGLLSGRTARAAGLSTSSLQAAFGALQERHLLRSDPGRGQRRYRLVDPFFRPWMRLARPF